MREEPTRGRGGVLRGCPDDRPALGTVLEKFLSQFPLGVCRGHRAAATECLRLVAHGCASHSCGAWTPEVRAPARWG